MLPVLWNLLQRAHLCSGAWSREGKTNFLHNFLLVGPKAAFKPICLSHQNMINQCLAYLAPLSFIICAEHLPKWKCPVLRHYGRKRQTGIMGKGPWCPSSCTEAMLRQVTKGKVMNICFFLGSWRKLRLFQGREKTSATMKYVGRV